jgi:serine protein kinase
VKKRPLIVRSSYQRMYDMILSYGREEYVDSRKRLIRYPFFRDEQNGGNDAIFGLDIPLMRLVHVFAPPPTATAREARHLAARPGGLVQEHHRRACSRSGVEHYSRTDAGALYTWEWRLPDALKHVAGGANTFACPMNEEPLRLIPRSGAAGSSRSSACRRTSRTRCRSAAT